MAGAIDLAAGAGSATGKNLFSQDKNPLNELDQGIEDVVGQKSLNLAQMIIDIMELPLDFINAILEFFGLEPLNGTNSAGAGGGLGGAIFGIIQNIIDTIVNALTGNNIIGNTLSVLKSVLEGVLGLGQDILDTIVDALGGSGTGNPLSELFSLIEGLPGKIEQAIAGALTDIVGLITNPLGTIETWIKDILNLLGNPGGLGTGTTPGNGGGGTSTTGETLATLLGSLNNTTQVSADLLKSLAPGAVTNILKDPNFATGAGIQGQGLWVWDGWINNGTGGSIRTVRRGLITVYVVPGTPGGVFTPAFESGLLQYLSNSAQSYLGMGYMYSGLDESYFETIFVPYPSNVVPSQSVAQGITWLTNAINTIPGPFILVGAGQGSLICDGVYDLIRYGTLTGRANDLLAGVMFGNMRREEGHAWPGFNPPANTSGCVVEVPAAIGPYTSAGNTTTPATGNLIDTESKWWDFCAPGDYLTSCPVSGTFVPSQQTNWMLNPQYGQPMAEEYTAIIDEIMVSNAAQVANVTGTVIGISGPMGYYYQSYGTGFAVNDHFRFGSVSKGFVANAILKAVSDGLLTLDDTLDTWYPSVANASTITIREMLMQTSGVYDTEQDELVALQFLIDPTITAITPASQLSVIEAGTANAPPGTVWYYTESNFILLGFILQTLYSKTAAVLMADNVCTPMGLTNTSMLSGVSALPSPACTTYELMILDYLGITSGTQTFTKINVDYFFTAGNMQGTIGDLVSFGTQSGQGALFSADVQQERMTVFTEPGTPTNMATQWSGPGGAGSVYQQWGLGWFNDSAWFGNDGSEPGNDCCVMYEPVTQTTIAVAENFQTTGAPYILNALSLHWYNLANYLLPGSVGPTNASYSPGSSGNAADISLGGGVQGQWFRVLYDAVYKTYLGNLGTVATAAEKANTAGATQIKTALALENYYAENFESASSQYAYFYGQPNIDDGDARSYVQIGLDYINSFAGGVHPDGTPIQGPPLDGQLLQFEAGQRTAVQPGQVVQAGASIMWNNIFAEGELISVGVNAYDSSGNLIATVTATQTTITDPEPTSNWGWYPVSASFVMPVSAATACLVFTVEPAAAATGDVWFTSALFAPTTLIDAALLDVTNIPQLSSVAVAGPQGEADLATAWQNLIDQLASASSQTNVTGVQLAQMLQSVGVTATSAATALEIGVANNQVITNVSNQPVWSGLQPSGQVTFPLSAFTGSTLPSISISSGTTLMGFINSSQVTDVGFVEFMAKGAGGSGVYVNLYSIDTTTATQTLLWASTDISGSIANGSWGWVGVTITTADQPTLVVGTLIAVEIVAQSSTISVVAETLAIPNNPNSIPPNVGASRSTSSTGGVSPTTLTASQLSYGGTCPFACVSVSALPAAYQPPSQTVFNAAGIFSLTLPTWLLSGDYVDSVLLPGGGAGGWGDGTSSAFNNGQGGNCGVWQKNTYTYGTDFPTSVTELTVIVGSGGCAPSGSGTDTLVGYGTVTQPSFDALGAGANMYGTGMTWNHTATAGAYILVGINTGFGTYNVTYGGVPMIPLGLVYNGNAGANGATIVFGLADVPGGVQAIGIGTASKAYASANSISYNNVSSVALVANTYGTGTALSQSTMCAANQYMVQFLGSVKAQQAAFSGGTNRWYGYYLSGANYYSGLSITDASASATIGATNNLSDSWGGISVVLNPSIQNVLAQTTGGQGGGPGGSAYYNPANTNTSAEGLGQTNTTFNNNLYVAGASTTATHLPGNAPGGGSSGGDSKVNSAGGAQGSAWITSRQNASTTTALGGLGGGGGSELTVTYEATGSGIEEATAGTETVSWTHSSDGGPACCVVLWATVQFYEGSADATYSYGTYNFPLLLDQVEYYNHSGTVYWTFAVALIGAPSGSQTVSLTITPSGGGTIDCIAANTVSYLNVGSIGNCTYNSGDTGTPTLSGISASTGQMVVAGFGGANHAFSSFNQTQRWNQSVTSSMPMVVGDASGASGLSFTASTGAADYWGGISGILIPVS
jgi:CubicO group peptidase (beta-lactamase class C family)